jgi:hypothetical protein
MMSYFVVALRVVAIGYSGRFSLSCPHTELVLSFSLLQI